MLIDRFSVIRNGFGRKHIEFRGEYVDVYEVKFWVLEFVSKTLKQIRQKLREGKAQI